MTQTFTPEFEFTAPSTPEQELPGSLFAAEPPEHVLRNILQFSKSLEIKSSRLVNAVEIIKTWLRVICDEIL